MMHNVRAIQKFGIKATDGEIGTVHDILFDDEQWTTRYLVVDTMKWLPGRKVLISPMQIDDIQVPEENVKLSMDKETIKNSPDINTDRPVSRQHELLLGSYYGFSPYWSGIGFWGPYHYPRELARADMLHQEELEDDETKDDCHLRSVKEVVGYEIEALDGNLGHVEDFIIDEENWTIRYIVVGTKNWWPGKEVLVSPAWITDVNWSERSVKVDLTTDAIKDGPEYNSEQAITKEFEESVYSHYDKKKYWL
jgi:sporulation protein YlmC with PRC-barrel domain